MKGRIIWQKNISKHGVNKTSCPIPLYNIGNPWIKLFVLFIMPMSEFYVYIHKMIMKIVAPFIEYQGIKYLHIFYL